MNEDGVIYIYCHADPDEHLVRRATQLLDLGCSTEYVTKVIDDLRPRLVKV
jgi:hypothetical protein